MKQSTNKQPQTTEIDTGDPYSRLSELHQQAVDLKLENFAYRDIAFQLKVKPQTIRQWFMTGGICLEAYQWKWQRLTEERAQRFKEVEEQLKDMAADAIVVVKNRLRKGSESAAFKILEMVGYGAIQKIQNVGSEESEELKLLRQIVSKHEDPSQPVPAERKTN